MTTLYEQISKLAAPIVKHYQTDVHVHDKGSLARMVKGDQLLWACRDYGSHIAWLVFNNDAMTARKRWSATITSRSLFHAANEIWPGMQWYLVTATADGGASGSLVKLSLDEAERLFAEKIDAVVFEATPPSAATTSGN